MFKVHIEEKVLKDLDKIPVEEAVKIRGIIRSLHNEPRPKGSKKLEGKGSFYRIRQGDFRIIYEISFNRKEISIVLIGHRKNVYRGI
ncbi:MAG: type II toxin-antitoxin system RelE/ParE family toxin [Candidatus Omnitrophota bacterium]